MKKVILVSTRTNSEGELSGYVINFSDGSSVFVNANGFGLALRNSGLSYTSNEALQLLVGCTCATPVHKHKADETVFMADGTEVTFSKEGYHVENGTVLSFSLPEELRFRMAEKATARQLSGEKTDIELALEALFSTSKRNKVAATVEPATKANPAKERINKTVAEALEA